MLVAQAVVLIRMHSANGDRNPESDNSWNGSPSRITPAVFPVIDGGCPNTQLLREAGLDSDARAVRQRNFVPRDPRGPP